MTTKKLLSIPVASNLAFQIPVTVPDALTDAIKNNPYISTFVKTYRTTRSILLSPFSLTKPTAVPGTFGGSFSTPTDENYLTLKDLSDTPISDRFPSELKQIIMTLANALEIKAKQHPSYDAQTSEIKFATIFRAYKIIQNTETTVNWHQDTRTPTQTANFTAVYEFPPEVPVSSTLYIYPIPEGKTAQEIHHDISSSNQTGTAFHYGKPFALGFNNEATLHKAVSKYTPPPKNKKTPQPDSAMRYIVFVNAYIENTKLLTD